MKPQQLANVLNITSSTLRRWAGKEYGQFLSPNGAGLNGARRSFNDRDARVIAWIAQMKAQNISASDIYGTLKSSEASNWRDLPPMPGGLVNDEPIAVVPREAVEERVRALQDRYEMQLIAVVKERDELKTQLESTRRELDTTQREAAATHLEMEKVRLLASESRLNAQQQAANALNALQERITDLSTKEAELRGRLEQYNIGGRRLSAASLLIVGALVIGALMTTTIIVIALLISRIR